MEMEEKKDFKKAKMLNLLWVFALILMYFLNLDISGPQGLLLYWGVYFSHLIFLKRLYKVELVLLASIIVISSFGQASYLSIRLNLVLLLYFLLLSIYYTMKEGTKGKWLQVVALLLIFPSVMVSYSYTRKDKLIKDVRLEKEIKETLREDWGVEEITVENLEKIRRLSILYSDQVYELEGIEHLKNLEHLNIWQAERIKDFDRLVLLPKLKRLWIHGGRLQDLSALARLQSLEDLEIGYVKVNGKDQIKALPVLKRLSIIGLELEDLSIIEELTSLEQLSFTNCKIKSMKKIDKLENLKSLEIQSCTIEDLDKTPGLKSLEAVDIRDSDVENMEVLRQMPNIKKLILGKRSSN